MKTEQIFCFLSPKGFIPLAEGFNPVLGPCWDWEPFGKLRASLIKFLFLTYLLVPQRAKLMALQEFVPKGTVVIVPVLFNLSFRGTPNLWACKKKRCINPRNDKSLALTREEV